jgi:hypothetical protein
VTGDLASGQNVVVQGAGSSSCLDADATWAGSWSNAGTITMAGACESGVTTTGGGTFLNSGTVTSAAGADHFISGSFSSSGTFNVNSDTAFSKPGSTFTQTGGTTVIAAHTLDLAGSADTFQLQGGLLQGTGTSIINGTLANSGGSVVVGSATKAGHMSLDGSYSQGSGAQLTIVIDGTTIGSGYSQLSVSGSSTLGGKLTITTLSGPVSGKLYTIEGGGPVSGKFATITGLFVPNATSPTAGYQAIYDAKAVGLLAEAMFPLQVKKAGPGTGTVTSSPAGINCGSTCKAFYFQTQNVTLTAHPGSGWVLGGWTGGCTGSGNTCQVRVNQARTVTATFSHATTTRLTASKNPVKKGKKVTFTATVSPHPDGGTGTGKATCTITTKATGSHRVQAKYSGDAGFAHSTSNTLTERVTR